jgi:hypothetical protein
MDPAEGPDRFLGRSLHLAAIAHVEPNASYRLAEVLELCQRALERRCFDIGKHHLHVGAQEGTCHRKADAAGSTGDERDFADKILHCVLSPEDPSNPRSP